MTDKQKNMIAEYREAGYSYTKISKIMDLSINSIKTFCKRHGLGGVAAYRIEEVRAVILCENCGNPVTQNPGRKQKKFCSDKCRMAWWNSHQDQVNRKANYEFICQHCKKVFIVYGNANRRFCSHACYIEDRFGGVN